MPSCLSHCFQEVNRSFDLQGQAQQISGTPRESKSQHNYTEDMRQKLVSPGSNDVPSYHANFGGDDYDVVFVGGGVAGYVGAIKAGQEGLKASRISESLLGIADIIFR